MLHGRAEQLAKGLPPVDRGCRLGVQVPRVGPLRRHLLRGDARRRLRRGAGRCGERAVRRRSSTPCSIAGVALAPGAYEVLFPSLAHSDDDIDRTVDIAGAALAAASSGASGRQPYGARW